MFVPQGCRRHHTSGTPWKFKQAQGFLQLTRATSIGTLVMSGQRQAKIKFLIYPTPETARKGLWGREPGQSATIH